MSIPVVGRKTESAAAFGIIARQFAQMTGLQLTVRQPNRLEDASDRRDLLFGGLADLAVTSPHCLDQVARMLPGWLARCDCETLRALAGYVAYCRDDYVRAASYFLAAVGASPENLDNWIDLAFALCHQGDDLGRHILFNHDEYLRRFVARRESVCSLSTLRSLRGEIEGSEADYRTAWVHYVPADIRERFPGSAS